MTKFIFINFTESISIFETITHTTFPTIRKLYPSIYCRWPLFFSQINF